MADDEVSVAWVSLADAFAKGPAPAGKLAVPIFAHGSLDVLLYEPRGHDPQKPHDRDEVYVVGRGRATFFDGGQRHPLEAGDFIFVAADQLHRFEDMSDD